MNCEGIFNQCSGDKMVFSEERTELAEVDIDVADFSWYRDDFYLDDATNFEDAPEPHCERDEGFLLHGNPAIFHPLGLRETHDDEDTRLPAFARSSSLPKLPVVELPKGKRAKATPNLPVPLEKYKRTMSLPMKLTGGTALGNHYEPTNWDVVCGRGRGE